MILREFVSKSLFDILTALDEVEKQTPGTIITGFSPTTPDFVKLGVTQMQTVDFEVWFAQTSNRAARQN